MNKLNKCNVLGKAISNGHFMPKGGWFKYVSSPHLLAEITMYTTLTVILWHNSTWKYVLFWVLANQVCIVKLIFLNYNFFS